MIEFGREYYNNDMYFFLKKRKDSIDVYYSVGNTITEARTMDEIVKIPLINETKLKLVIEKLTKSKKKFSKKDIKRIMDKISSEKGEIEELVDYDGSFSNSKVPIHDPTLSPTKTMDQTVFAARQATNPLLRGYRVYYGESEEKDDEKMLDEYNLKPTFAYDETEDVSTYEKADEVLIDKGIEDDSERHERLEVIGNDPK